MKRIIKIPSTPMNWVESRPKACHCWVVSLPKINADKVIQIREAVETIQTIQDASHTNVPTKATRSPTEPANQE